MGKRKHIKEEYEEDEEDVELVSEQNELDKKTIRRLKTKISSWLDYDDKIKLLNNRAKKYKEEKKRQEEIIMNMIEKLNLEDIKIDINDDNNQSRGRVYRYTSTTKATLKEEIIKDALMEVIKDEKRVNALVKKIDNKRPIKTRYYLKRTKGNKND